MIIEDNTENGIAFNHTMTLQLIIN